MKENKKTSFEEAGSEKPRSLLVELWLMLKHNKKYWLIPLILGLLAFGLLIVFSSSAAAPFIYTLF